MKAKILLLAILSALLLSACEPKDEKLRAAEAVVEDFESSYDPANLHHAARIYPSIIALHGRFWPLDKLEIQHSVVNADGDVEVTAEWTYTNNVGKQFSKSVIFIVGAVSARFPDDLIIEDSRNLTDTNHDWFYEYAVRLTPSIYGMRDVEMSKLVDATEEEYVQKTDSIRALLNTHIKVQNLQWGPGKYGLEGRATIVNNVGADLIGLECRISFITNNNIVSEETYWIGRMTKDYVKPFQFVAYDTDSIDDIFLTFDIDDPDDIGKLIISGLPRAAQYSVPVHSADTFQTGGVTPLNHATDPLIQAYKRLRGKYALPELELE